MLWRLSGVVAVCFAPALLVAAALAGPVITVAEDHLHLGCDLVGAGDTEGWVCPDRIGYVLPVIGSVAGLTTLGVVLVIRLWAGLGGPSERLAAGALLSRICAVSAVGTGAVTIAAGLAGASTAYGPWLVPVGLVCCLASGGVLSATRRGSRRGAALADVACALLSVSIAFVAILALPVLALSAGAFLVAAALLWPNARAHPRDDARAGRARSSEWMPRGQDP